MIKVAVVGAGHWGPNLIGNFHNHGNSEVAWVVDRSEERLAAVSTRFPDIKVTKNLSDVLDDANVDAVVVATPTTTHYDIATAVLRAGKHVLVEKPLADTVEKSIEMNELAEQVGKILMVGHVFVYNAAAQLASYDTKVDGSFIVKDLHKTRNMRLAFKSGFYVGGMKAGLMTLSGGRFPGGKIPVEEDAAEEEGAYDYPAQDDYDDDYDDNAEEEAAGEGEYDEDEAEYDTYSGFYGADPILDIAPILPHAPKLAVSDELKPYLPWIFLGLGGTALVLIERARRGSKGKKR